MLRNTELCAFPTDSPSELDVFGHDGDSLGMDSAKVGVLKEANQVGFTGFLQGHDGRPLEAQVSLEVLSDLTDQPLERQFADEKLSTLLVPTNLPKSDGSRPVSVRFLYSTSGRGGFPRSLGGQLLSGSLPTGTLASSLLGSSHDDLRLRMNVQKKKRREITAFGLYRFPEL